MLVYKYNNVFAHVEQTLFEQYDNDSRYDNVLVVLGYNVLKSLDFLRKQYPTHKIIIYQLEQLYRDSFWVNKHLRNLLNSADEVWDYDWDNILWARKNYKMEFKLKPLMYTESLKIIPPIVESECDIDVLFYGYLHERRAKFMYHLQHKAAGKIKIFDLYGVWGEDLDEYIRRSKIIINIHTKDNARQEQPRIYYPIINGRCVLSERSPKNYIGNAVVQASYEDMVDRTMDLIEFGGWFDIAQDASDRYKLQCEKYKKLIHV